MNNFGNFLYELRKENNMTQAELALKLGVTNKAVSKWETGEAMPETSLLVPLSKIFGVSVDELLNGERNERTMGEPDKDELCFDEMKKHAFTRGKDDPPKSVPEKVCGAICGALVLAGVATYLFLGGLWGLWAHFWVLIPVSALSCGIIGITFDFFNAKKREIKRSRGENPYIGGACGIVMLLSIIIYLLLGGIWGLWHPHWTIIIGGVVICGILGIFGDVTTDKHGKK